MFLKYQRLTAILHTNAVQESYDEIQMIKNRTVAPIGLNTLKTIGGSNELLRFFMINSKNMHIFFFKIMFLKIVTVLQALNVKQA